MGGLINLIQVFFFLFNLLILARVLMSYINPDPTLNQAYKIVYNLTEPILAPVRRMLPQRGMIDFSPLAVLVGSFVIQALLISLIRALF
ncbi:MAG TPA: YggT family protein [Aggregatilineales bacterium]|nr:YggT family protein [Anaerolineales bacterium]HRE47914.1 YggT family protein [Aggregatilineales bacterium]